MGARLSSCLAQEEEYVLACYRYIEFNPVHANMIEQSADYPWSIYRTNAQGEASPMITPHGFYSTLGPDIESRQHAYSELF